MSQAHEKLLVIGGSGHASVVIDAAVQTDRFGFIEVIAPHLKDLTLPSGLDIPFTQADLPSDSYKENDWKFVVAIGDNKVRSRVQSEMVARGFVPTSIIHPSAYISPSTSVGTGSVILACSVVQVGCDLGDGVIVNNRATLDHHCMVGAFAHIGPGASLAGNVSLGREGFIGTGASVIPGVKMGDYLTLGAGAVMVGEGLDGTWVGVPARQRRGVGKS